ncbi:MAG: amidophosphoribosyltransferase [Candidatus Cloacimonadota bacterium]|nr:amidophosphoribosyltransferase [Candidatus Cloacimonadota bacterium]
MCGIIGIFGNENAAELATLGLFAEQHRGQESCGMAVHDGHKFVLRKKMGLVKEVFRPQKIKLLQGKIAIGHVRYPTCGSSSEYNSQPHIVETLSGPSYALASNGDIINYTEMRQKLENKGIYFASYNDGELLLKYIVYQVEKNGKSIVDAIKLAMQNIKGAFSTVLGTRDGLYVFRDPYGIRPLSLGKLKDGSIAVASESCALDILHPDSIREVAPAEIVEITKQKLQSHQLQASHYRTSKHNKHCIFEHVYFARPDSFEFNENVYQVRMNIGSILAKNDEADYDIVVPVPDSANFIALGFARQKNIPYEMGLIRNHYVGRTFIKPEQTIRDESVNQKFNPLPNIFKGKNIALVDDSIVRGTTLRQIVKMVRKAGANQIHLRIGSPMVKFSCFYGIDTPSQDELIANNKSLEAIRDYLGADSVKYLQIEQLQQAVKKPQDYCYACFNGKYPVK